VWKGVHIQLTPQDLTEPTMPELMREDARWQARSLFFLFPTPSFFLQE
jgi:hypothetical protein